MLTQSAFPPQGIQPVIERLRHSALLPEGSLAERAYAEHSYASTPWFTPLHAKQEPNISQMEMQFGTIINPSQKRYGRLI